MHSKSFNCQTILEKKFYVILQITILIKSKGRNQTNSSILFKEVCFLKSFFKSNRRCILEEFTNQKINFSIIKNIKQENDIANLNKKKKNKNKNITQDFLFIKKIDEKVIYKQKKDYIGWLND